MRRGLSRPSRTRPLRGLPASGKATLRSYSGFTMIELLITVALSTLVGVLIYTVFIEQTKAYRLQSDMGNMQQNLRVAMEMLSRDVGSAGFGMGLDGGTWGASGQAGSANAASYGLWIREDFPVGGGSDAVEIAMMDPDRSTWSALSSNSVQCNTNVLTFATADAANAALYSPTGPNKEIVCWYPTGYTGRPSSFIWSVSAAGDSSAGTVPVTANSTTDFNNVCPDSLPTSSVCAPSVKIAYYIDRNGTDGIGIGSDTLPVLYLVPDATAAWDAGGYPHADDIPVALGIEDMQFQICQAGLGRDCELTANWESTGFDMDSSSTGTNTWTNLQSVRINLLARTLRADLERTSVSQRVDLDANDTFVPTSGIDSYHRRVARTEVTLRNAMGTWMLMNSSF